MMLRWLLAGIALAMGAVPIAARAEWYQATSAHFTVYAEGKPEALKDYIGGLERYDAAMRILYSVPDLGASSTNRVTIFVVASQSKVEKLFGHGGDGVAGFYNPRASGSVAFVSTHNDGAGGELELGAQAVLFHEYAHHFMYTAWPDEPLPAWLVEGFAEFNAPTTIEKNGDVLIGNPPLYRAYGIFSDAMPMKRLMASSALHHLSDPEIQALYGRGWLLLHYLVLDHARAAQFAAYRKAMDEGKSSLDAATLAFGDLGRLDSALDGYARGRLSGYRIPARLLKLGDISVRPLTPGEAAVMPALLQSQRGVDDKTAPAVAALAEKLAGPFPDDAGAQNELAEAEYDAGRYAAADAAAARAAAADPKSLHALIYRGMAQMALAAKDETGDAARWSAIRRWFLTANRLDTENAEPLRLFYQSFIIAKQTPTANAQAGLLYAQQLAPFDDALRLTAVNVLLHQDKATEAKAMLRTLAYDPHGGSRATLAARMIDDLAGGDTKKALADMEPSPDKAIATDAKKS